MRFKIKTTIGLLALLIAPAILWAEVGKDVSPDEYYQSALQAYLNGDMDQAILLDSKSLQMNPQNQKAQALLTVLIGEKDTAQKTVIWIGGKPATVEAAAPVSQAPVTVVKTNWTKAPRLDTAKLQEVEARIQTITFLLQRDSINQYKELTGNQMQTTHRLDEISFNLKEMKSGLGYGNLLFLLALIIACLALWNSWRTRQEMKKQSFRGRSDDSHADRVVNLR
jgi:hypothetical protein